MERGLVKRMERTQLFQSKHGEVRANLARRHRHVHGSLPNVVCCVGIGARLGKGSDNVLVTDVVETRGGGIGNRRRD